MSPCCGRPETAAGREEKRKKTSDAPFELHRLDVEAERGADGGDVLAVEPLDDRGLPRVVQAAVGRSEKKARAVVGRRRSSGG